jgi:hypothetical protein
VHAPLGAPLTLSPRRGGGLGGAVTALDAAYILQYLASQRSLDTEQRIACDVTGNGSLSTLDATRILQYAVGMADSFPAATLCGSDWLFFPDVAGAPPPTVLPPSFAGGQCQRGAIAHQPLTGAASEQRFRGAALGDCTGNWQSGASLRARGAAEARVSAARPRRVRGQLRLPIHVAGHGFSAVELSLHADPTLTVRAVELSPNRGAAIRTHAAAGGSIAVAIASATPLDRARITAVFDGRGTARLVASRIDESPARSRQGRRIGTRPLTRTIHACAPASAERTPSLAVLAPSSSPSCRVCLRRASLCLASSGARSTRSRRTHE